MYSYRDIFWGINFNKKPADCISCFFGLFVCVLADYISGFSLIKGFKWLLYIATVSSFASNSSNFYTWYFVFIMLCSTGWPVIHSRVLLVPCKTWLQCTLLYCSVHYIASLFTGYQNNTAMFTWLGCHSSKICWFDIVTKN